MDSIRGIVRRFKRRFQRRARVLWRTVLVELAVLMVVVLGLLARLSESAEVAASARRSSLARRGEHSASAPLAPLFESARPLAATLAQHSVNPEEQARLAASN